MQLRIKNYELKIEKTEQRKAEQRIKRPLNPPLYLKWGRKEK